MSEGGREEGREGRREREREGGREGGREKGREGGREGYSPITPDFVTFHASLACGLISLSFMY